MAIVFVEKQNNQKGLILQYGISPFFGGGSDSNNIEINKKPREQETWLFLRPLGPTTNYLIILKNFLPKNSNHADVYSLSYFLMTAT